MDIEGYYRVVTKGGVCKGGKGIGKLRLADVVWGLSGGPWYR
jgi:hypothetical protein